MEIVAVTKRVTEDDRRIGKRLKARRIALGVTQADLAEVIGVTFQNLQHQESGKNRISASNLAKLAKRLSVSVAYFISDDDNPDTDDGIKFLGSREGASIVRAMAKIDDKRLKKTIAELITRLADAASLAKHPLITTSNWNGHGDD